MIKTSLMLMLVCLATKLGADTLDRALALDRKNLQVSAAAQERIDGLDDRRREALEEYLQLQRRIELVRTDNRQLQSRIDAQEGHKLALSGQLEGVETTRLGVLPLMQRMEETLTEFVARDLPFLPQERQSRLDRLTAHLGRPDASDGERFRQLLDAYQIELEYGRTIEGYQGPLNAGGADAGASRTVSFLRLGRAGLFYLTPDEALGGVWNPGTGRWEPLEQRFRDEVGKALQIARHQAVPQLVTLPLTAPVTAEESP